ncbi:hypothetical protein B0H19DRAFT_1252395 [Mycena capillaripes]|nr:hypothetical protein B0H19DRAFT_1252395 [Mycena capillaripes]
MSVLRRPPLLLHSPGSRRAAVEPTPCVATTSTGCHLQHQNTVRDALRAYVPAPHCTGRTARMRRRRKRAISFSMLCHTETLDTTPAHSFAPSYTASTRSYSPSPNPRTPAMHHSSRCAPPALYPAPAASAPLQPRLSARSDCVRSPLRCRPPECDVQHHPQCQHPPPFVIARRAFFAPPHATTVVCAISTSTRYARTPEPPQDGPAAAVTRPPRAIPRSKRRCALHDAHPPLRRLTAHRPQLLHLTPLQSAAPPTCAAHAAASPSAPLPGSPYPRLHHSTRLSAPSPTLIRLLAESAQLSLRDVERLCTRREQKLRQRVCLTSTEK